MTTDTQLPNIDFDHTPDGVVLLDQDCIIRYMNSPLKELFGEGVGQSCHDVIKPRQNACPFCDDKKVPIVNRMRTQEIFVSSIKKSYDVCVVPYPAPDGAVYRMGIYRDITKRKLQEAMLRRSEVEYKSLFEHVGCGVFVSSKEGKFLDVNQAMMDMLGYESKEEFLKIDLGRDLYLRPEDRKKFQRMVERDGQVIDYEVDFKRKDGTPFSALLTVHVRYDQNGRVLGYEGINVDQNERKRMEQELRAAHDFLNKFIHSSPNAIMAADMKGNMIIWNQAAEEILEYRAADVMGKMNITQIYPEGLAYKVMDMLRSDQYGGPGRLRAYPMVFIRKDGEVVEGTMSAAILTDIEGKEIATVGIFVDLKERLEMERKLHNTQEQLLQSEKLAAMGRLTSQLAHELNNPLYGIMNTLELLKTEVPVSSKRRKILEMALSETIRLSEMLRKMLSFSKPDQEEKKPTDMNTILDEILLLYHKQLQEFSIKIRSSFDPDLEQVYVSTNQMRQVFLNLISNARDAMPEGGKLYVSTHAEKDQIRIRFGDTGIGIHEEHLKHIFDTFFTTKDDIKGVGLGLSVCYGFIQDHGGDIKVDSTEGEGTTFTIILPAYRPNAAPADA